MTRLSNSTRGVFLRACACALVVVSTTFACTSGAGSSSSSSGGAPADASSCPLLTDGCNAYACTCGNGASHPLVSGKSPSGSCETLVEACARTCAAEQGVSAAACGSPPALKDAAADVVARKACDPGGFCNVSAGATCKDSSTVRNLMSECPDSGSCPTVAEAAEAACVGHGGVDYIVPSPP